MGPSARRRGRAALAAFLAAFASGTAGAGPFDDGASDGTASLPPGVTCVRDVPYGADARQRFDVYAPAGAKDAPVIFMVHGGAWLLGDKASRNVVENKVARWAPRGFIFISADYRMVPDVDPLKQAEDVARALAAAQARAGAWGGDPSKFILMGHSAGGHLVALLAAAPSKAFSLGANPWLGTILLDSGALDLVKIMASDHFPFYDRVFGRDRAYWREASPLDALSGGTAPMLLVCSSGRRDSCSDADGFAAKVRSMNGRAEVVRQPLSHRDINKRLGVEGPYTDAVDAFIASLTNPSKGPP